MSSISGGDSPRASLPRRIIVVVLLGGAMNFQASDGLRAQSSVNKPSDIVGLCLGSNLFVDDYLMASSTGLKRTMHSPEKVLDPVLYYELLMLYMKVLYDPDLGRYRMPGFDWADCVHIRGDFVSHRVEWRGNPELPKDELVSIEFSLRNPNELYGFDFAQVGPTRHPTVLKPVTKNTPPKE